jgi:putative ABC transport system permease protein
MLTSYLKIAFRNFTKTPVFSGINVLGLSVGLTVSLLLFLHLSNEYSFDRFHSKQERIYRVMLNAFWEPAKPETLSNVPNSVAPVAKQEIAAVEQSARVLKNDFGTTAFVSADDKKWVEDGLFWVDEGLLDIFDFQTVAGDLRSALANKNTLMISRSTAIRYFGTDNPVGKTVQINRYDPMEIRGVFEDFPAQSSFKANMIAPFSHQKWAAERLTWSNSSFETWLLLNGAATREAVEGQLAAMLDKNVPKERQKYSFWLQPLRDVHFGGMGIGSNYSADTGDPKQAALLGILALAVLLIACFNYMNLSTARAQMRFRDVGINKTMGATRRQLAVRFYVETAAMVGLSLVIALGLSTLAIPLFNQLADKSLTVSMLLSKNILLAIGSIGVAVVLLAGSYPAFFLSAFSPKNLLHTTFRTGSEAGNIRRTLVMAQFAASVVLIIGTIVLYRQMQFIQQKNLGFNAEQVLIVTVAGAENKEQIEAFEQECKNLSHIHAVCRSQSYPGRETSGRRLYKTNDENEEGKTLSTNRSTPGFEQVLGLKLLAGTTLPQKASNDTIVHVVLTKNGADYLGLTPEACIGLQLPNLFDNSTICVGVVEDFHSESLHSEMGCYAFHDAPTESRRYLMAKLNTQNLPETMRQVEACFRKTVPNSAFEFKFLDDHLDKLYRTEQRTAKVMLVFSLFSILISCLGLFGLAAFAAERRVKEIGVRRVLGATVLDIAHLLSKDFLGIVLLSIAVAVPIAWFLLRAWLSDFAYHIDIQWWMFAVAGMTALAIAFLTVGYHGVKAALSDPVKSLRSE